MSKSKVQCPRCFSENLYKYGFDKYGNQKYQCKDCKRQFAPETLEFTKPKQRKYPSCPKCGKATFLHHDYKYYSNLRCSDKSCNHSFFVPKDKEIDPPSYEIDLPGKFNFKGMRYSPYVIRMALYFYFLHEASTREVSQFLRDFHNIQVSHVTIASWTKKFAPMFKLKADNLKPKQLNHSNQWHADETVVKLNGQKYYLWAAIDSKTKYILSFHLDPHRNSRAAFRLFNDLNDKYDNPELIVSDRYWSYLAPIKVLFPDSNHIRVESFEDNINNNVIESFFGTFKDWYNKRKGFKSYESANQLITMFIFFYNYIKPHSDLDGLTPAQKAGIKYSDKQRKSWLLAA